MPKKYEREIEEILRNMERSTPKEGFTQRIRRRGEKRAKRTMRRPSIKFGVSEWCLLTAWLTALLAGGWAYAHAYLFLNSYLISGADLFTGTLTIISVVFLLVAIIAPFLTLSHSPGGQYRQGNVTAIRRNPLSSVKTRWNLFMLKMRYRRRKDH